MCIERHLSFCQVHSISEPNQNNLHSHLAYKKAANKQSKNSYWKNVQMRTLNTLHAFGVLHF